MSQLILTLTGLGLCEIIAFYYLKKFSLDGNFLYYIIGILSYCLAATILAFAFLYTKIGVINLSWNIISTIYGFIVGFLIFKEHLTAREIIGAILGFIGLLIMS